MGISVCACINFKYFLYWIRIDTYGRRWRSLTRNERLGVFRKVCLRASHPSDYRRGRARDTLN